MRRCRMERKKNGKGDECDVDFNLIKNNDDIRKFLRRLTTKQRLKLEGWRAIVVSVIGNLLFAPAAHDVFVSWRKKNKIFEKIFAATFYTRTSSRGNQSRHFDCTSDTFGSVFWVGKSAESRENTYRSIVFIFLVLYFKSTFGEFFFLFGQSEGIKFAPSSKSFFFRKTIFNVVSAAKKLIILAGITGDLCNKLSFKLLASCRAINETQSRCPEVEETRRNLKF